MNPSSEPGSALRIAIVSPLHESAGEFDVVHFASRAAWTSRWCFETRTGAA